MKRYGLAIRQRTKIAQKLPSDLEENTRPGALKKSMLVWDQFRSHLTDTVKDKLKSLKTFQAVIPGGLTSFSSATRCRFKQTLQRPS